MSQQTQIYSYDGTLEGLFTVIALCRQAGCPAAIDVASGDLLFTGTTVETDPEGAAALMTELEVIGGSALVRQVLCAMLAEDPSREMVIYEYVIELLTEGRAVWQDMTRPVVQRFRKLSLRVASEAHRFKGLLRFEELDGGLLWASFKPDHNIAALLARHFAERMSLEFWVICDVKRGLGFYYDTHEVREAVFSPETLSKLRRRDSLGSTPDLYAALWRQYFSAVAIRERTNLNLQQQCMPKKYWRYLTEKL